MFLAGLLVPFPMLRILGFNLTFFDLIIVAMGCLMLLHHLPFLVPRAVLVGGTLVIAGLLLSAFRAPFLGAAIINIVQWIFIVFVMVPIVYSSFNTEQALWYFVFAWCWQ